jgi:hypothetical protein
MSYRGIQIRDAGDRLYVVAPLKDDVGGLVTSSGALLYLERIRTDGTLDSYDFADNTFKTGAVTTETQALTHRKSNNGTVDTGLHTYMLTTVSGFTAGDMIVARAYHPDASPTFQEDIFQYGGAPDVTLSAAERLAIADATRARQLTEGYAGDGLAPTLEQALFRIMQNVTQFGIVGTALTVKKLDKTTVAETYTLDSATVPTSRTRAS